MLLLWLEKPYKVGYLLLYGFMSGEIDLCDEWENELGHFSRERFIDVCWDEVGGYGRGEFDVSGKGVYVKDVG